MQGEEAQQQPSVTSADSYDAAQTALGMVNPGEQAALKEAIRQNIGDLQLTPEQLDLLIQVFEYVSQNPGDYKNLLQKMIEAGALDEGDMPEEYDPEFIGAMLAVLQEMRQMQGVGAQEPMDMGPVVEGLQPMGMAQGGLADVGQYLASKGRGGDSILAHITPEEAAMLKRRGGSGTINPATGLPEFKGGVIGKVVGAVKSVVKSVVNVTKQVLASPVGRILGTVALATVLGPAGVGLSLGSTAAASAAINMGLASAGTTLLGGGSVKDALVSGAMGYIGGGGTIMGASPVASLGQYLPGAAGTALNTGLSTGLIGAGIGKLGGMSTADALKMGLTSGATAAAMAGLRPADAAAQAQQTGGESGGQTAPTEGGGIRATGQVGSAGEVGPTGTAQDLLASRGGPGLKMPSMGPSMSYDPMTGGFKADYSLTSGSAPGAVPGMDGAAGSGLRFGGPSLTGAPGMGDAMGAGLRPNTNFTSADYSVAAGGKGLGTNYSLAPTPAAPAAAAQPTGFIDKIVQGGKDLYNEYLSPSRPGLAADAGILSKYGPLAAAGTAVVAAAGGMDSQPSNPNPAFNRAYTGSDYMRDNPQLFSGGLSTYTKPATPDSPIVPTPSYATIPIGQPGTVTPGGITRSPAGVAQPYNVAGLYGVPLIYGPDGQPIRMAKGGDAKMTHFPRRNGPISGPGTGTSDDIPAMLSDGEFVFTAKAVRNAGGGSRRKGAARMYKLMKKLEGGPV
jgi:hypothetical protein